MTAFNTWLDRSADLSVGLRKLVVSIEEAWAAEGWDCCPAAMWEPYVAARAVIGAPVRYFPGGEGGEHVHFLKDEGEECAECAEAEEARGGDHD